MPQGSQYGAIRKTGIHALLSQPGALKIIDEPDTIEDDAHLSWVIWRRRAGFFGNQRERDGHAPRMRGAQRN